MEPACTCISALLKLISWSSIPVIVLLCTEWSKLDVDSYQMTLNRHVYFRSTPDPQEPLVQGTSLEQKPQECTKSGCCVLSSIPSCSRLVPLVSCCSWIHSPRLPLEFMWKETFSLRLSGWMCRDLSVGNASSVSSRESQRSSSSHLVASLQGLMVSGASVVSGVSYSKAPAECSSSVMCVCVFTFHMDTVWFMPTLGLLVLIGKCGEIPSKLEAAPWDHWKGFLQFPFTSEPSSTQESRASLNLKADLLCSWGCFWSVQLLEAETMRHIFMNNYLLCNEISERVVQHFVHCIETHGRHVEYLRFLQTIVKADGKYVKKCQDMVMTEVSKVFTC